MIAFNSFTYVNAYVRENIIRLSTTHLITHAGGSRGSIAMSRVCVRDYVCLSVYTIKPKRLKLKSPNLAQEQSITSSRLSVDIKSLGQRSRSQAHKVQKGDRVAAVSYALYRVPECRASTGGPTKMIPPFIFACNS